MPEQETPHDVGGASAVTDAWWERYNEAIRVGLTDKEAISFATHGDIEQLRKLVAGHCPLNLMRRILR